MDETYGTYVDVECFDIHDYDDGTDHDTYDAVSYTHLTLPTIRSV